MVGVRDSGCSSALTIGLIVVADGSHRWRIQKTKGSRGSNAGRVPNTRT